ncbi:MAG: hypothetical protein ACFFFG_05930 [Candidatus Thorarchaeota archaeon]
MSQVTVVQCPNCHTLIRVITRNLEVCCVCYNILVVAGELQSHVPTISVDCKLCDQLAQPALCPAP